MSVPEERKKSIMQQMNGIVRDIGRQVIDVASRAIDEDEAAETGVRTALSPELQHRQFAVRNLLGGFSKMWLGFLLIVALLPLIVVVSATRNSIHFAVFMLYIPTLILFMWAKCAKAEVMGLKDLLVRYAIGFTVEFTLVANGALVCTLVGFVFYALITLNAGGTQDEGVIFIVYSLILSIAFVIPEEAMKFSQTANFFPYGCLKDPRQYNVVNSFATLGFATSQLVVQSLLFFAAIGHITKPVTDDHALLLLVVICATVIPMHVLTTYHIGIVASRRLSLNMPINKFCFMLIPILFRTLQLYTAFFVPLFPEPDSLESQLIMFLCPLGLLLIYMLIVKYFEKSLPATYLDQVGYLSFCGMLGNPGVSDSGVTQAPPTGEAPRENEQVTAVPIVAEADANPSKDVAY